MFNVYGCFSTNSDVETAVRGCVLRMCVKECEGEWGLALNAV